MHAFWAHIERLGVTPRILNKRSKMSHVNAQAANGTTGQSAVTAAASSVDVGQPQENPKLAEVVQLPGVKKALPNIDCFPMTLDARLFYERHNGLGRGIFPIRCYLEMRAIVRLARCLRRQITVEDFESLIGVEAASATCSLTGQQFLPVWWTHMTESFFARAHRTGKIPVDGLRVGAYFLSPDTQSDDVVVLSGYPYSWGRGQRDCLAENQPLVEVYKLNNFNWGYPRKAIDHMVEMRREALKMRTDREVRLVQLKDFFKAKKK